MRYSIVTQAGISGATTSRKLLTVQWAWNIIYISHAVQFLDQVSEDD